MAPSRRFEPGGRALLVDSKGRRYLITLQPAGSFHFHRGIVSHDEIIGEEDGSMVRSTQGEVVRVFHPTITEFVLKMPRGAQVIYPKDLGAILVAGDIFPGATVLEAGIGSGALTIALLRAVGPDGRVISYELREEFAEKARSNVEAFLGPVKNHDVKMASVYEEIDEEGVDRAVLDLPEPWRATEPVGNALRTGGILVSYLPTIIQVQQLSEQLQSDPRWASVLTTETLVRGWKIEGMSVRPEHRMVGHTGFVTIARRVTEV
jgi:tRNA (adenine57-N1/adenine58-N1)-methyltransferase catalytic subunit